MSMIGLLGLLVAFAGCVISVLCLGVAHILYKKRSFERSDTFAWGGRVAAVLTAVALTVCCAVLVWCFFSGDNTIQYVLDNRSTSTAPEAWLYKLAGLWAGRQGSLLFWAWLIAVFNAVLVFATRKNARPLDNGALAISSLVLTAFVSVLLFSEGNMPFIVTDSRYFGDDGTLSVMVGGDKAIFDKYYDLMKAMAGSVVHTGDIGAGNVTKLANQVIVALNIAAMSEALTLATKAGVNPDLVYQAIRGGLAGSTVLDAKAPMVMDRNFKPGFRIDLHIKDLANALDTSHGVGAQLPLTAAVMEMMQALRADGLGTADHSALACYYEKLAKVEVTR